MAVGLIGSNSGFGSTISTVAADTTAYAGKAVVIGVTFDAGNFSGVSDSQANTWLEIENPGFDNFGSSVGSRYFRCDSLSASAAHTFTLNLVGGAALAIGVAGITDSAATPFDKSAKATDTSSPFSSGATATTTQASEVALSFIAMNGGSGFTAGGSATKLFEDMGAWPIAMSYQYLTVTGTPSGDWTVSGAPGSPSAQVYIGTFKANTAPVLVTDYAVYTWTVNDSVLSMYGVGYPVGVWFDKHLDAAVWFDRDLWPAYWFDQEQYLPAVTGYTLTAAAGVYNLTGNASALRADRRLVTAPGAYNWIVNVAGLYRGGRIGAVAAGYTLSGNASGLRADRKLSAAAASFAFTGNAAGLLAARRILAAAATYSFTGNDVTLTYGATQPVLVASSGSYLWTANAAGLRADRKLTSAPASFSLTGNASGLRVARKLPTAAASYSFTGNSAGLTAARRITMSASGFVWTVNAATLRADRRLIAAPAAYSFTGNNAALVYAQIGNTLHAESAAYVWTVYDAALTAGYISPFGGLSNERDAEGNEPARQTSAEPARSSGIAAQRTSSRGANRNTNNEAKRR